MSITNPNPYEDRNLVCESDACPTCGQRDADELIWIDDDRVECQRCKTIYRPGAQAE